MACVRYLLAAFFILLLEGTVVTRIELGGIRPDLALALVAYAGLFHGGRGGVLAGFLMGLLRGCGEPEWLGLDALLLTLVGFAAGSTSAVVNRSHPLVQAILIASLLLIHDLVRALIVTSGSLVRAVPLWLSVSPATALYTALVAPLAVLLLPWFLSGRTGRGRS